MNDIHVDLNILIVDDDQGLLSVLSSLLREERHTVSVCDNGLDAIEKCQSEPFDLIITDLMMPGASGLDVLKASRQVSPDTLVILITGFASIESAIQAIREGAYDYVTKPFKLEEIKIAVNNAKEKIQLVHENKRLFNELEEAYKQLRMVRQIMGINGPDEKTTGNAPSRTDDEPLIAGSLLPSYYLQKQGKKTPFVLSLERLSSLRKGGFLSNEEFDLCKAKLLNL